MRTRAPMDVSDEAMCEPIKPAPPVTSAMPFNAIGMRSVCAFEPIYDDVAETATSTINSASSEDKLPADAYIFKAQFPHVLRFINVA